MQREPIFNIPPSVMAALGLLAAVHVGLQLLPTADENWTTLALAFIPARYGSGLAEELPGGWEAAIASFATYQLVHADITHLLVNGAWLLAFGSAVARRVGTLRFFLFATLCGAAGALLFLVLRWGELVPVVGASGAVSGLMAAALRFFFGAADRGDLDQLQSAPESVPLISLAETLTNRRILTVVVVWTIINFVMAMAVPASVSAGGIAWEVHLGGFIVGLLTFGAFDRAHQDIAP
ncbi:MAG: rhomboid family intramembrane serine protease [Hyphomicrobiaceae bacterium]